MVFDSHAHLNDERFAGDFEQTVARAAEAGVTKILIASYDEPSSLEAVRLARMSPGLYCSVGIHPHDAAGYTPEAGERIRRLAMDNRDVVVAVGEIGLDYDYDLSPRDIQQEVFEAQIRIARDCGLPIIVHDREAHGDMLRILESCRDRGLLGDPPGVMHCFSGSAGSAEIYVKMGFYLSFAGTITFRNARRAPETVSAVPKDRILVETDSPYLSPEPYRGMRNEPARAAIVAGRIAEIWGVSAQEAGEITAANACRLFSIA